MKLRKTNHMSEEDHKLVSKAVSAAEKQTDGEIVTIVADISGDYHETGYVWASISALMVLASFALFPKLYTSIWDWIMGGWTGDFTPAQYLALAGSTALIKWLSVWGILHWRPLRLLLTWPAVKRRTVRDRAINLFLVGTKARTEGRTGILIYLSMKEHRAEIVADDAIAEKVNPEIWGDAMVMLIDKTREGRPGAGMAQATTQIGEVLCEHFPKSDGNSNELPDRLIEL